MLSNRRFAVDFLVTITPREVFCIGRVDTLLPSRKILHKGILEEMTTTVFVTTTDFGIEDATSRCTSILKISAFQAY